MALADDVARQAGVSPRMVGIAVTAARALWKVIPQEQKDKLVAFAISKAKALAWTAFKHAVSYAAARVSAGVPPETFPGLGDAPPWPMDEGGSMVLNQTPPDPFAP